jgi:DNA-binding GntR family transcriptional regulator
MTDTAPASRSDWAHRRLKAAILTGELAPGAKLVAGELATRFAVSPTPLREAFHRLGGSGLVELTSQRGARVTPFSLAEAADLYELRLLLEPEALRRAVGHGTATYHDQVERAFARLERSGQTRPLDPVELAEAHVAFHDTLVSACPSAWMRRMVGLLAEHAQRYQILGAGRSRRGSDPRDEHRALRDAAVGRKAARAATLIRRHLEATLASLRTVGGE